MKQANHPGNNCSVNKSKTNENLGLNLYGDKIDTCAIKMS